MHRNQRRLVFAICVVAMSAHASTAAADIPAEPILAVGLLGIVVVGMVALAIFVGIAAVIALLVMRKRRASDVPSVGVDASQDTAGTPSSPQDEV